MRKTQCAMRKWHGGWGVVLALAIASMPAWADELPAEAKRALDAYVKAVETGNPDGMWELYGERERQKVRQQVQEGDRTKWLIERAKGLWGKGGKVEVTEVILGATVSIAHVKFPSGEEVSLRFGKEEGGIRILDERRVQPARNLRNEVSAQAMLKQLVSTEGVWRQIDGDMNGTRDYWTLDGAGFYYRLDASGNTLKFVDVAMAKADKLGLATYTQDAAEPRKGYWLRVMKTDEQGEAYAQDVDGDGAKATNPSKYGYCAYPAEYGVSGTMTYIVNEEGVVYERDLGADAKDGCDRWPGADPTTAAGWVACE